MIKLTLSLTTFDGKKLCAGELVVSDSDFQGRLQGQFRYTSQYLQNPSAFPLDPIHLSLSSRIFDADRPGSGVHGVFEDSLPDDWGRKLMARRYRLERNEQRVPSLLQCLGENGLGAISYEKGELPQGQDVTPDQYAGAAPS